MQQAAAEFHALYTRNTQKKHKTWQDAIVKHKGNKLYIYENDDSNTLLGSYVFNLFIM
jgi:hypothetical protein